MNTPMTLVQLQNALIAAKRQGWEEGRAVAVNVLSLKYQGMGAEDKIFVTALTAEVFAAPNPYGEPE